MFEKFTDRARLVLVVAQQEATARNDDHLGTEHFLLALVREPDGIPARTFEALDIPYENVREQINELADNEKTGTTGELPITEHVKKLLELSLQEANELGHDFVDAEHLLLGLLSVSDGIASKTFERLGTTPNRIRQQLIRLWSGNSGGSQNGA
ncbi:Clp protease N-terminal domain-containing protein [Glutamicibacter arilaitensis]|uniref:Clp protease N-terminal domain-containing protein n=1 Tax=Glutamicibacter arilaitensis TaxID=256701 RepID=UPI00384B2FEF